MGSLHSSASTDMLRERVLAIHRTLGTLHADIDAPGARQWRSVKLSGSGILAFVSLVLLPPTGELAALAAFAAGLGMLFWANELREDAEASNRSEAAIRQYRQLVQELDEIEAELKRRHI